MVCSILVHEAAGCAFLLRSCHVSSFFDGLLEIPFHKAGRRGRGDRRMSSNTEQGIVRLRDLRHEVA